ncbi:MAG: mannose-1-phosphate guanyltransferase [Planctomycetota bacterium]|nr:MAG: mannose-1-phosphate guanyltransferase [Planctomycetota bacterium]
MLYPIVMAGGAGTRFWPLSRSAKPKQLLAIVGEEALLRQTWRRLASIPGAGQVRIATRADLVAPIAECVPELGATACIVEPEPRDTAPCVALASAHILATAGEEAEMAFLPADQWIEPAERLQAALQLAANNAKERQRLVTLGIKPTRPETGFGYIHSEAPFEQSDGFPIAQVASFVEKPDEAKARKFVEDPAFLWNSGIFVWQLKTLLRELEEHAPEFAAGVRDMAEAIREKDPEACDARFRQLPKISLDYALFEKTDQVDVVHVDFTWDDVGGFASVASYVDADQEGNRLRSRGCSKVTLEGSRNNLVLSEGEDARLLALVGCEDLVVVDTKDATLICPKAKLGELKKLVTDLGTRGLDEWS